MTTSEDWVVVEIEPNGTRFFWHTYIGPGRQVALMTISRKVQDKQPDFVAERAKEFANHLEQGTSLCAGGHEFHPKGSPYYVDETTSS